MATSGSKDYTITRADIIERALRKTGAFDQGESIPGAENAAASDALNLMVKEWSGRGIDLWLRKDVTLFLQPNQQSYLLGATDHATTDFAETTLSSDYAASSITLDVGSTTGMTAADNIGIKLDDKTIQWTTIATVDDADTVTLDTGLTGTASSGNKVYAYTTRITRPQRIVYAYRRDTSGIDTDVELIGEKEYQSLSQKGAAGPINQVYYRPILDAGKLFVWPTNSGSTFDKLVMVADFPADDMDTQANNPEFPIEWGNALVWNLAADLSFEYGLPRTERSDLYGLAEKKLNDMLDYDVEYASVVFGAGYDR